MVSVPAVLILVPPRRIPVAALSVPVTDKLPVVPASVNVKRVFGEASASLMVSVPFVPRVASVRFGAALLKVSGEAPDSVTVPEAAMVVALAIAPVLVMPPLLLFKPPVIEAPPLETVNAPAEVIVPDPVVEMLPLVERLPFSSMVSLVTPADLIAREVFTAALVSSRINAEAVPAFVNLREVAVPELLD